MQLLAPFDARSVDPVQSIGSLPIGKHPVVIESSDIKATKANAKGQSNGMLRLVLSVIDGPAKGTTGGVNLNIYHSGSENSAKTVEIAMQKLSAICHVTGVFTLTDTTQLHGIPFIVEVVSQNNAENPHYTEVKRVFDIHGHEPVRGQGPQAPQVTQPMAPAQPPQPTQLPAQPPQAPAWNQPAQQPQQPPQPTQQPAAAWNTSTQAPPTLQAIQGGAPPWGGTR